VNSMAIEINIDRLKNAQKLISNLPNTPIVGSELPRILSILCEASLEAYVQTIIIKEKLQELEDVEQE